MLTTGEVAKLLSEKLKRTVLPREITAAFYAGWLDNLECPIHAGRRMIQESQVDAIAAVLKRKTMYKSQFV